MRLRSKYATQQTVVSRQHAIMDTTSYKDRDFSWGEYEERADNNDTSDIKLVLCTGSIHKLPASELERGFDLVILEECLFMLYQLASTLRNESEKTDNVNGLESLLKKSMRVICTQGRMVDECVDIDRTLCGTGEDQTPVLQSAAKDRYVPMKITTEAEGETNLLLFMVNYFTKNITQNGSHKPFLVFSNKSFYAKLFAWMLRKVEQILRPLKPSRILLLEADTVGKIDCKNFAENRAKYASNWDVVIATPALQGGLSINTRFEATFDFFYPHILSHDERMNLMRRFQPVSQPGVEFCRYSFFSDENVHEDERESELRFSFEVNDMNAKKYLDMIKVMQQREKLLSKTKCDGDLMVSDYALGGSPCTVVNFRDLLQADRIKFNSTWLLGRIHEYEELYNQSFKFTINMEELGTEVIDSIEDGTNLAASDYDDLTKEATHAVASCVDQGFVFLTKTHNKKTLQSAVECCDRLLEFFRAYKAIVNNIEVFVRYINTADADPPSDLQILADKTELYSLWHLHTIVAN